MKYQLTVDCPKCHISRFVIAYWGINESNTTMNATCSDCSTDYVIFIGKAKNEKEL